MHLAYIHFLNDGPGLNHVRQFSQSVEALGHRVDVHGLAPSIGRREQRDSAGKPTDRQPPRRRVGARYLHEPRLLLLNGLFIAKGFRLLRRRKPEVLLVRHDLLNFTGLALAHLLKLPLVLEVNGSVAESHLYRTQYVHLSRLSQLIERRCLQGADATTVVSSALREFLVDRYGLPEDRFTVVPNGADVTRFHPDNSVDPDLPSEFTKNPVVGFVGSFHQWHGVDLLVAMILGVADARPNTRFLLVGDGPLAGQALEALEPISNRVLFTGWVDHTRVPGLVAGMTVAVMPGSNFYGSPLKVMEYMAAGRAVVAPGYGPLREVIDSGVHGTLFEPGDLDALTAAVIELLGDEARRNEMVRQARERVCADLTWESNACRVLSACETAKESFVSGGVQRKRHE